MSGKVEEKNKMWKMSCTFLRFCVLVQKSGYCCLMHSAHFLLDGSIHRATVLSDNSPAEYMP